MGKNEPIDIALGELSKNIGRQFDLTNFFQISQGMIDQFADLTNDRQWVHVDVARASAELGGTIAHGYLVLSLVPSIMSQLIRITGVGRALNYGVDRVRFMAPVFTGQDLAASLTLVSVEPKGEGLLLTSRFTIGVPGADRPSCSADTLILLFPGEGSL